MSSTTVCFIYLLAATVACLEFLCWEKTKSWVVEYVIRSSMGKQTEQKTFCAAQMTSFSSSLNSSGHQFVQADFNVQGEA